MKRFPLRYAHQNILVGHGDARAALFRVDTVSYPFLANADKREWLRRLARFAFAVEADFSIWRVCRAYPADGYADQAMALLDERNQSAAAWRSYLAGHEEYLRGLRSFTPEVYLAVSLPSQRSSGLDRARRRFEGLFGVAHPVPIPGSELDALVAAEERAFRRAEGSLPVRRATTRELQWLLRRAACRGVAEPALDDHWEPSASIVETADGQSGYEPLGTDLVRHANAPVLEQDRSLLIDAEEGRSHQALLGMGALPEESEFPGGAELLFSPLEALSFPVDVALHARCDAAHDGHAAGRQRCEPPVHRARRHRGRPCRRPPGERARCDGCDFCEVLGEERQSRYGIRRAARGPSRIDSSHHRRRDPVHERPHECSGRRTFAHVRVFDDRAEGRRSARSTARAIGSRSRASELEPAGSGAGPPDGGAQRSERADAALLTRGRHAPRPRAARAPARAHEPRRALGPWLTASACWPTGRSRTAIASACSPPSSR
ncbi:hypothetical protein OJ998_30125 [Solirubrobacter taibaiensis]|nr:hypothetical protein [Solirubrobacter taibaiensis]